MNEMQQAISRWAGGLKATSGAIDTGEKTWVYPISFKFDESGKWSYKTTDEINTIFHLYDDHDNLKIISKLEPHIGKETLGAFLAPDGNN